MRGKRRENQWRNQKCHSCREKKQLWYLNIITYLNVRLQNILTSENVFISQLLSEMAEERKRNKGTRDKEKRREVRGEGRKQRGVERGKLQRKWGRMRPASGCDLCLLRRALGSEWPCAECRLCCLPTTILIILDQSILLLHCALGLVNYVAYSGQNVGKRYQKWENARKPAFFLFVSLTVIMSVLLNVHAPVSVVQLSEESEYYNQVLKKEKKGENKEVWYW